MRLRMNIRTHLKRLGIIVAVMLMAAVVLDRWVWPLPVEQLHRPHGQFVYARDGRLIAAYTSSDRFWRKSTPLNDISPRLVSSVIASEDRWFYWHPGFNPVSLITAAVDNLRAGHVVRGGSTVTMQIARMIEPKDRTIGNKLREIARAIQLECHYSKNELLEMYLNLVPYGGNIEGVGGAALMYFDKEPSELTWAECATLVTIPVSPTAFRPDRDSTACRIRRDRVLARLHALGMMDDASYRQALAEEIPAQRVDQPFIAPHFAQSLVSMFPDSVMLHSTLNTELQAVCQRLAERHQLRLRDKDINNLSVVILDNHTGDILAMVGSPDFNDRRHQGQINGALAPRSPGSALKPFVYALAFDSGQLSPEYRLADIPVNYSGYSPENYDEQYHGMVSVRDALINSYNVPAVRACADVGLEQYYNLLKQGGLSTLDRPYYDYGLPLVLGACEITLLDLSGLYAMLARGGERCSVHWLTADSNSVKKRVLSPEASYLVTDILCDLHRPDLPTSWEFTADMPVVAWKTGTSYGRRDAWTIGYNERYTVGVWAGNFTGEGSVDIVGAKIAAPLMLSIFDEISDDHNRPVPPDGIALREVCAVSGQPPNEFCPHTVIEKYIPGRSSVETCNLHKMILVDSRTGHRVSRATIPPEYVREEITIQWPPRVASWLQQNGAPMSYPERSPQIAAPVNSDRPVITSPENRAVYVMIDDIPADYQRILLEASVAPGCDRLHWFIDNTLYASGSPCDRLFLTPTRGRHEVMCVDNHGRSQSITVEIR